jgi:Tol biopolymer transport system component
MAAPRQISVRPRWWLNSYLLIFIVLATVGGCLAVLIYAPEAGSASFDIDEDGNFVVSSEEQLFWTDSHGENRIDLTEGWQPRFLPGGDKFLFTRDNTIWVYSLEDRSESQIIPQVKDYSNFFSVIHEPSGLVYFTRAKKRWPPPIIAGMSHHPYDIYSCEMDGSNLRQITDVGFDYIEIEAKSVAGNFLYFSGERHDPPDDQGSVFRLNIEDETVIQLENTAGAWGVSVSNDGSKLAITRHPEYYSFQVMDLETGKTEMVRKAEDELAVNPTFSRDDQSILFSEDKKRDSKVKLMRLSLSDQTESVVIEVEPR